ncbi:MAG: toxin [Acidimicrobiia bacterium]|nr:toxin [Acidimicrobiia bacterium]
MARRSHRPDDRRGTLVIPAQGDIWWAEAEDKRRPVLVVTRSEAIPVLSRIVVAPVTRTIRRIPTEVPLDHDQGLGIPCAASFDNLQPITRTFLTQRVGSLSHPRQEICRALGALADC